MMAQRLYNLDAQKTYAIICILSSEACIFDILGGTLQNAGKINIGSWFGLKGHYSESHTKDLRESRIRALLNEAKNMKTGELIDAVRGIGKMQCADAIIRVLGELNEQVVRLSGEPTVQNETMNQRVYDQVSMTKKKTIGQYETVNDILLDEDNFGLIIMNMYLKLETMWEASVSRFIELGIDIPIDQNTISQKKMKGKFYLESLKNVKLIDFLSNLDAIGCELVKDIDAKLQELNSNVVREKKVSFSGKNEVAKWCSENNLSHLYDQLISLGFDSLAKLKQLDDQSCTEMGIKGFSRIELKNKVNLLK